MHARMDMWANNMHHFPVTWSLSFRERSFFYLLHCKKFYCTVCFRWVLGDLSGSQYGRISTPTRNSPLRRATRHLCHNEKLCALSSSTHLQPATSAGLFFVI